MERTQAGFFSIKNAYTLENLEKMRITEKNLNDASGESIKFGVIQGKQGLGGYYADILRFLLHKEVNFEIFNSDSYLESLNGENLEIWCPKK